MNSWAKTLDRSLKGHDRMLYVQETRAGRFDIYRKSEMGMRPPHFLFSLTDNWQLKGTPVPWGTEVVLNRIKAHDLWRDDTFVERWIKDEEARKESKERARRNSIESFLYDFRSQFHRATSDINTSNLK